MAATLENPNIFCLDGGISQGQPAPRSIRCPHCRQLGVFGVVGNSGFGFSKRGKLGPNVVAVNFYAATRICPNPKCRGLVFSIEENQNALALFPPELIDFDPKDIPANLLATLKEAISCHAAGAYRASTMMVRRLLEELCEINGAQGGNLHQRIGGLKQKVLLSPALFEALHELKALGNDAAHVEAKAYDSIGKEEAFNSIELAKEILKALYQHQSLLTRLQSRRTLGS